MNAKLGAEFMDYLMFLSALTDQVTHDLHTPLMFGSGGFDTSELAWACVLGIMLTHIT
jgi:hypothetical protein